MGPGPKKKTREAVVLPVGDNGDGSHQALVYDENGVQAASLTPRDQVDNPDDFDTIKLSERDDGPFLNAVITEGKRSASARRNHAAYRDGWERIFGNKEPAEA